MPQTCRPIIDRLKGLKPDTNPSFLQLFYSFSTAFPQLFYSLLTTCSNLLLTCSNLQTTCVQITHNMDYIVKTKDNPRSLHVHHMSLFHIVQWRRLAVDGGGFRRGKTTGCSSITMRVWRVKKKPLLLDYIAVWLVGLSWGTICHIARGRPVIELQPVVLPLLNPPRSSTHLLRRTKWKRLMWIG